MSTYFAVPSPIGRWKMILLHLASPLLIQVLDRGAPCQHRVCLPVPSRGGGRRSRRLISALHGVLPSLLLGRGRLNTSI